MIKLLRGKKRKYPGKSRSNIFVWRAIFGVMILVGSIGGSTDRNKEKCTNS